MERHFEQFPEILETLLLAISNNRALINVTLESVGLTMEDARMIGRIMKKLKLISLILPRNSLGRVGAEIIAKQLRTCRSIRILDLSSNNTGDSGTIAVIMACQDHPSIQSFAISANDLTSAIIPSLCDYVKSSSRLEKLDVSHNHIGRDIIKLLHAVARSQTLEVLNIGYNAGTESCVGAIKHVLVDPPKDDDEEGDPIPTAPQLTELNLEGNQLSPDAGIMIKHALKTNINILHINLEANFLIKHDIIDIEKALAVNRLGAEIKFKFRPQVLQQKWNWNAATIGTKNIRDKKIIPKRTDEDVKIERARAKQKRKRDAKNGKRGNEDGPPCSIL
jgi:Ran GTPase-activating protein (RanGAP) involved in mRNA processing and transport